MASERIRIAIVQSRCGHLTCVGPNDYEKAAYSDAMDAAIGWHIEAGYQPAARYWAEVDVPAPNDIPMLSAAIGEG